jgi:hypothetical protein
MISSIKSIISAKKPSTTNPPKESNVVPAIQTFLILPTSKNID